MLAEWLGPDGSVLAVSDYEQRDKYLRFVGRHRAPFFATHWTHLLRPLVPDYSDEKGLIRYRQIEYSRMPLMAYLAMDDARALTRADFVRLGLVTGPGKSDVLPYSARYMRDFENRYCYDQFWNEERSGRPGTRFMSCGHGFVMVGDADDPFFVDREAGLLGAVQPPVFPALPDSTHPQSHAADAVRPHGQRVEQAYDRRSGFGAPVQADHPAAAGDLPALHPSLLVP